MTQTEYEQEIADLNAMIDRLKRQLNLALDVVVKTQVNNHKPFALSPVVP